MTDRAGGTGGAAPTGGGREGGTGLAVEKPAFSVDAALRVFKALFDDIANPSMNLLGKDYEVLWANQGMATAVQRQASEMIGKPCYEMFRRLEEPCDVCLIKIVKGTKQPCVIERSLALPGRERVYAEVRAYPILDDRGSLQYLFEMLIMLTEKKKNEERHRRYVESLEKTLRELTAPAAEPQQQDRPYNEETTLTARETEVLRLVAKGFSNREIASIFGISPDTVKTHIKNIFGKLNATDRTEAAVWASLNNLV
jgi:DNA-binding CsgD family transcriptional regulator